MAWNVSEGEPTCPTSSFFAIQLLAHFRLAQRSYAPGWSLEWHLQRTPNQGKIVPPARFALCPSTVNQSRVSAIPWSFKIPPCCLSAHQRPTESIDKGSDPSVLRRRSFGRLHNQGHHQLAAWLFGPWSTRRRRTSRRTCRLALSAYSDCSGSHV